MGRISKETMEKALAQLKTISEEDYAKVKGMINVVRPVRSVLHKNPDDYGMRGWSALGLILGVVTARELARRQRDQLPERRDVLRRRPPDHRHRSSVSARPPRRSGGSR